MHPSRALVIIGGLILCIGARLPWISVPVLFGVHGPLEGIEVGWEDNGIITGGIGLILLLIGLLRKGKAGTRYSVPGAILATLACFVVVGCFKRVLEINPQRWILCEYRCRSLWYITRGNTRPGWRIEQDPSTQHAAE
jgi:hypothetical protein